MTRPFKDDGGEGCYVNLSDYNVSKGFTQEELREQMFYLKEESKEASSRLYIHIENLDNNTIV
jgi:hypothetical protein